MARFTIACPICETRPIARSSKKLTNTLREIIFRCENDECGHIYVATLEVVRTIVPSAIDNPNVKIPLSQYSPAARRRDAV